ncbi:hypothetical protein [Clostridium perfringens]|uniref:hypothetical protein n=1 Tax=Clostridium perfringens TaxID=1502 RepID=UPI002A2A83DA|nr:hypothetical protein [Clostridium perfringens]
MKRLLWLQNGIQNIKDIILAYDHITIPVLTTAIYFIFLKDKISLDDKLLGNLVNVSAVIIGFLITIHSIIISLPKNSDFMKLIKINGYIKQMYIYILLGEISLLICLICSLFNFSTVIAPLTLILGIVYSMLLSKTFFLISFYND